MPNLIKTTLVEKCLANIDGSKATETMIEKGKNVLAFKGHCKGFSQTTFKAQTERKVTKRCHDIRHNGTQPLWLICDIQHKVTLSINDIQLDSILSLRRMALFSVAFYIFCVEWHYV